MKAITILEPWASLIACGAKQIETRGWSTKYRGPIAIHAAKSKKMIEPDLLGSPLWEKVFDTLAKTGKLIDPGHVIAIADLVDCIQVDGINYNLANKPVGAWLTNGCFIEGNEYAFGNYPAGGYAWILDNVQPIEPVPAKGQQRIWEWMGNKLIANTGRVGQR